MNRTNRGQCLYRQLERARKEQITILISTSIIKMAVTNLNSRARNSFPSECTLLLPSHKTKTTKGVFMTWLGLFIRANSRRFEKCPYECNPLTTGVSFQAIIRTLDRLICSQDPQELQPCRPSQANGSSYGLYKCRKLRTMAQRRDQ